MCIFNSALHDSHIHLNIWAGFIIICQFRCSTHISEYYLDIFEKTSWMLRLIYRKQKKCWLFFVSFSCCSRQQFVHKLIYHFASHRSLHPATLLRYITLFLLIFAVVILVINSDRAGIVHCVTSFTDNLVVRHSTIVPYFCKLNSDGVSLAMVRSHRHYWVHLLFLFE